MTYKKGDILLINYPFTNLKTSKKRPVLLIQDENNLGDFVCFQITSKKTQDSLKEIENSNFKENSLKFNSYVKFDKCFTLNSSIADKKLTSVNAQYLEELKTLFCENIF